MGYSGTQGHGIMAWDKVWPIVVKRFELRERVVSWDSVRGLLGRFGQQIVIFASV